VPSEVTKGRHVQHRLVESFKFAYAKRSGLGDAVRERDRAGGHMTSSSYGRSFAVASPTTPRTMSTTMDQCSSGRRTLARLTCLLWTHDGNAVVTLAHEASAQVSRWTTSLSQQTITLAYQRPPTLSANKRPMSSMAPVIVVNADGDVQFVSGAAGGSRITSAVAYTLARQLYLNETVKAAVDSYRLHHQLVPNIIKEELRRKGHKLKPFRRISAVQAIERLSNGQLQANADYHKPSRTGGLPDMQQSRKRSRIQLGILAAVIATLIVLVIVFAALSAQCRSSYGETPEWQKNCVSASGTDIYQYNAVTSDCNACSTIGDYVLNVLGGNAMDAGVATVLCIGVSNIHNAGIGGGSFLVYYNRSTRAARAFDFRESAPAAAHRDMYSGLPSNASLYGGLAIGVPGEVAGLAAAHAAHGRLPWRSVVEPVSRVLREGQRVSRPLAKAFASKYPQVPDVAPFKELKDWMVNPATGKPYKEGDVLVDTKLADTMDKIANDPQVFYNGSLADDIVQEVLAAGGNITKNDLLVSRINALQLFSTVRRW
uniref:Gamma-glutamyltranspeptidase 1 n=1 Tax=Macrostomum lignano TaxID=282301 RepID=A0A1I8G961_9PLAT